MDKRNLAEEMNKELGKQMEQEEKSFYDELDEEATMYEMKEEERKQKEEEERHEKIKNHIKERCKEVVRERECTFPYGEHVPHSNIYINEHELDKVAKELKLDIKFEGRNLVLLWPKRPGRKK